MKKIIECVPNFSEGRDCETIAKITAPFENRSGVRLLDVQRDEDHNRLVVTVIGTPAALHDAVIAAMGAAIAAIDMRRHTGQHPRMGAVDVVPFIPVKGVSMDEAVEVSKAVAAQAAR
ncbi:MAG: glutamate formimidoyltransferase, partial [Desulfobacterales bacterium]